MFGRMAIAVLLPPLITADVIMLYVIRYSIKADNLFIAAMPTLLFLAAAICSSVIVGWVAFRHFSKEVSARPALLPTLAFGIVGFALSLYVVIYVVVNIKGE
jgi:hypothetical protein